MKRILFIFGFSFIIFGFSSCSLAPAFDFVSQSQYASSTDFSALTDNLVKQMSPEIKRVYRHNRNKICVITDFVNIESLQNKLRLGFVLSNELRSSMSKYFPNIKTKALTLSQDLYIGKDGVSVLTRTLTQLKHDKTKGIRYILVGTYTLTDKKMLVFLRLVDYTTGDILVTVSQKVALTKEIAKLDHLENKKKYPVIRRPFVL